MEDTLQKAMTKFGLPRRLYFDNGTQYRTHWMKRACGLLGIRLLYAKPRNPQGKGKQERFNQTLDAFLAEAALHPPESLQELNMQFNAWLSECYHSKIHSTLGTTPEIAFKSDSMPSRFVDKALMTRAFLRCETRKADKSGVISFGGKRYDLGVVFAGQQVDVVYDRPVRMFSRLRARPVRHSRYARLWLVSMWPPGRRGKKLTVSLLTIPGFWMRSLSSTRRSSAGGLFLILPKLRKGELRVRRIF